MGRWKNHVHAGLQRRDHTEKLPFIGVFTSLSQMEERFEIRQKMIADVQSKSSERNEVEVNTPLLLQIQLKENEHLAAKAEIMEPVTSSDYSGSFLSSPQLSQTVSNLTAALNLKEAELQYWQSRVSLYRQEALALAKKSNSLKTTLSEFEFIVECQAKELSALRVEQRSLKEAVENARTEKERLLQRWMEEKSEEADRLNAYNDTQERWQHLAKQMKKHLKREIRKDPVVMSSMSDEKVTSPSAVQVAENKADAHLGPSD